MFKKLLLISSFVLTMFLPIFVLAADPPKTCGEGTGKLCFIPAITIPGFSEATKSLDIDGSSLAKYIVKVYRYGAMFAGVIAMFMLVYAGWEWLLAGGNSGKISQARDKINGALIGLVLLFGGYILLSLISVNLIQFKPLKTALPDIKIICSEILEEPTCIANTNCHWNPPTPAQLAQAPTITGYCNYQVIACPADDLVQDINIAGLIEDPGCSDCRLTVDTINKLKKAVQMLDPATETLTIKSAYRSSAKQAELYDCYLKRESADNCSPGCSTCQKASPPGCDSAHQTGTAVDICMKKGSADSCRDSNGNSYLSTTYNCSDVDDSPKNACAVIYEVQQTLKYLMEGAGFSSISEEWWHFQNKGK
jgi:D-alanyl-D-alanine dipeptidase